VSQARQIVIGDVHGHYDGLMRLLEAIAPSGDDRVYFLGDLIDRGPKSAQVLDFVQCSGYTCLLGNHEQLLLESFPNRKASTPALQAWLYSGGESTVSSYENPSKLMDKLDWIRSFPLYLDLGNIWLVHAGVHPGMAIAEQTRHEFCWIRDVFHSSSKPYFPDKLIITGHTITFTLPNVAPGTLARGRGWLDVDTGVYHPRSGWLTGFDVTHQTVYQSNVFRDENRQLPLDEACTEIDPSQIRTRQQLMHL